MKRNALGSLPIILMLLAFFFASNPAAMNQVTGQQPESPVPFPEISDAEIAKAVKESSAKDRTKDSTIGPKSKIREVLQGNQPAPTGDGVLEDVLGVIQRQGSVLDGSTLDPPPRPDAAIASESNSTPHAATRRALVAEHLLRAARMLEQISGDEESAILVASMRRRAATLLLASESSN
ncbi:hypothetical protein LF1_18190 [Rubripirellula obstinata]|uniref:Secreted protein n=1 Tax=Rubripirellula obstinata TaxID=406547 RepID=A0A5B1CHU7_9BACT|nr:hypothetical protein [Rubripirellula obstinata]KAA1259289.1 hypothetical protein LF1_18190 [Rubripirellula obstinata]